MPDVLGFAGTNYQWEDCKGSARERLLFRSRGAASWTQR